MAGDRRERLSYDGKAYKDPVRHSTKGPFPALRRALDRQITDYWEAVSDVRTDAIARTEYRPAVR